MRGERHCLTQDNTPRHCGSKILKATQRYRALSRFWANMQLGNCSRCEDLRALLGVSLPLLALRVVNERDDALTNASGSDVAVADHDASSQSLRLVEFEIRHG